SFPPPTCNSASGAHKLAQSIFWQCSFFLFFPLQKFWSRGIFNHLLTKGRPMWCTSITNRKAGNYGLGQAWVASGRHPFTPVSFRRPLTLSIDNNFRRR